MLTLTNIHFKKRLDCRRSFCLLNMTRLCFPKHWCKVRVVSRFLVLGRGQAGPPGSISVLDRSVFPFWAHP